LAFGRVAIPSRSDHAHVDAQSARHDADKWSFLAHYVDHHRRSRGPQREGFDLVDDAWEDGADVAVRERKHGVKVHRGAQARHLGDHHAICGSRVEQLGRELRDGLA
jgi:hypothetical protein